MAITMKQFKFLVPAMLTLLALCAIFACSGEKSPDVLPSDNSRVALATTTADQTSVPTTTKDSTPPVTTPGATSVTTGAPTVTTPVTTQKQEEKPPVILSYTPSVPKATKQAKVLYLIAEPTIFSDKLALASLQGLAAKSCEEQILITGGSYSVYRNYITDNWSCKFEGSVDSKIMSFKNLLAHYKPYVDGYILCSADPNSQSGSVAVSLAGILNAVVVTPSNQKVCDELGLECLLDVTDKDDRWLRA